MHWIEFWLHGGCHLGLVGSMCPMGGLDRFWEHFGSEMVAQRLDFEGLGLNLGAILDAF